MKYTLPDKLFNLIKELQHSYNPKTDSKNYFPYKSCSYGVGADGCVRITLWRDNDKCPILTKEEAEAMKIKTK
jgi:hypothetical protein